MGNEVSNKDDKLMKDHEYDGIQELDNDLPSWWVNLFYVTIVFSIVYLGYYHVFSMGPSQEQAFDEEMKHWEAKGAGNHSGKTLYAVNCLACHGKHGEGNSSIRAPQIAGQEDWYLTTQLAHFKNGIRGDLAKDVPGNTMRNIAKTAIPNDDIQKAMVDYVSSLEIQKLPKTVEGNAEKGKALYATCLACHGDVGQGNPALKAPRLTGLNDWYIVAQLKNFKEGLRGQNSKDTAGMLMRPMTLTLSEENMKDLAAYIHTFNK